MRSFLAPVPAIPIIQGARLFLSPRRRRGSCSSTGGTPSTPSPTTSSARVSFRDMDNNYCTLLKFYAYGNTGVGSLGVRGETWCYVSDKCTDLNGGRTATGKGRVG
ncbi:unnamed protein product [Prorocentrum cordatum]|uniref:Uncharacterized protein n=1 Tax=Prorocentrum cordatum TaxID=2364126 RepID=A0ABN9Y4T0_9DINO|nr:unnamed protein product [Polarella glacialis]